MSDGPSGTVTFLFTDVEGSTKLLERFADSYPAAIEQHRSILRETVDVHGEQVFETIGDAVYVAFPRAADCVVAALAAQCRLQVHRRCLTTAVLHTRAMPPPDLTPQEPRGALRPSASSRIGGIWGRLVPIAMVAVLMSCAGTVGQSQQTPSPTSTVRSATPVPPASCAPPPSVPPSAVAGTVIVRASLSDRCNGWEDEFTGPDFTARYDAGGLRMVLRRSAYDQGAFPEGVGVMPNDVRIEVDAQRLAGPDRNRFGVSCRLSLKAQGPMAGSHESSYDFLVGSDGRYAIERFQLGREPEVLASGTAPSVIHGSAANRIRADCVGSRLSLFVNGSLLAEVTNSDLAGGPLLGISLRSLEIAGVDIVFKNFVVTKL